MNYPVVFRVSDRRLSIDPTELSKGVSIAQEPLNTSLDSFLNAFSRFSSIMGEPIDSERYQDLWQFLGWHLKRKKYPEDQKIPKFTEYTRPLVRFLFQLHQAIQFDSAKKKYPSTYWIHFSDHQLSDTQAKTQQAFFNLFFPDSKPYHDHVFAPTSSDHNQKASSETANINAAQTAIKALLKDYYSYGGFSKAFNEYINCVVGAISVAEGTPSPQETKIATVTKELYDALQAQIKLTVKDKKGTISKLTAHSKDRQQKERQVRKALDLTKVVQQLTPRSQDKFFNQLATRISKACTNIQPHPKDIPPEVLFHLLQLVQCSQKSDVDFTSRSRERWDRERGAAEDPRLHFRYLKQNHSSYTSRRPGSLWDRKPISSRRVLARSVNFESPAVQQAILDSTVAAQQLRQKHSLRSPLRCGKSAFKPLPKTEPPNNIDSDRSINKTPVIRSS